MNIKKSNFLSSRKATIRYNIIDSGKEVMKNEIYIYMWKS